MRNSCVLSSLFCVWNDLLDAFPGELSGGQQQRQQLQRGIDRENPPKFRFLADEPTGNLDTIAGRDVMALLQMMSKKYGQTVVMITHNEELAQMADQIIRLEDGKIVGEHHAGE